MNIKSAFTKATTAVATTTKAAASAVATKTHDVTECVGDKVQAHRELKAGKELMGEAMRRSMREAGARKLATEAAQAEADRLAKIAAETQAALDSQYAEALKVYCPEVAATA